MSLLAIRETSNGTLVFKDKSIRFAFPTEDQPSGGPSASDESNLSAAAQSGKAAESGKETEFTPEEKLLAAIFGGSPEQYRTKGDKPQLTNEEKNQKHEALKAKIEEVLKTLTYREREIIKLRYGLGEGYTATLGLVN